MKKKILSVLVIIMAFTTCNAQEWMTSLDVAKRLALIQDKLIFMMWEDATTYPFPVKVINDNGRYFLIENLFESEEVNQLIWEHFVPVKVNESNYSELYENIKDTRPQVYLDKFNDDSIKIMDVNGNIINTDIIYSEYIDLSKLIYKYYLDTSFLKIELQNYAQEQNFTTAFRLAVKYMDAAIIGNKDVRAEIIKLSTIYLEEAERYLMSETLNNKAALKQKGELQRLMQDLILGKSKRVLRKLKRIDATEIDSINQSLVDFLYFTAYILQKDEKNASLWRSKLSLVNLSKANQIFKSNQ